MCYNYGYMKIAKGSLMLVGVLVGVIALTAPASARFIPNQGTTTTYVTTSPDTSASTPGTTSATTTATTTATGASETTTKSTTTTTVTSPPLTPPATAAQSSAVLDNLATQLSSLLKQLIAMLTTQLQDLQQQVAAKLGQKDVTTPSATTTTTPTTAPTTTAQTAATSTAAANQPPRVNIAFPYGGLELTAGAATEVIASALDEDGSIAKVEFFAGANSLGTHTGSIGPWSVRWSGIGVGTYSLTAKATDDKGDQTTSAPVTLKVKPISQDSAAGYVDTPPTITIATTMTGVNLTATATVSTYYGNITNVVWSRAASTTSDAAYVTDATSPYNGNAALDAGQHTISAIATNSQGSQTRTASTTVNTN